MNPARGEVQVMVNGGPQLLCLTLGALAEIQSGLGCASFADLASRLGRLSRKDVEIVLAALLRGGGSVLLARRVSAGQAQAIGTPWPVLAEAIAEAFEAALRIGDV
ncbi:MAG: GTA-gp10 family protein [Pseudomonadota bacterium]